MNSLGIYFGSKVISVTTSKGKQPVISYLLPRSLLLSNTTDEKVPEEKKLSTALKDEMQKHGTEAKEVVISLSGKDLIIRTFTLPALQRDELMSAVHFEVKKYIPFKLDEIVSDFQVSLIQIKCRKFPVMY